MEDRKIVHLPNELTAKIYEFIISYKEAHDGLSPTYKEIMLAIDASSTSVIKYHLEKLEDLNLIHLLRGHPNPVIKGIEVNGGLWTMVHRPKWHYNKLQTKQK